MTKTRRIFLLVSGVSSVMGIVAACTFPEPRIVDELSEGGSAEAGDEDTGEPGDDDVKVQDATSEGIELEAAPLFDATSD